MSGPLQWTPAGMVPANGLAVVSNGNTPGYVPAQSADEIEPAPRAAAKPVPSKPFDVIAQAKARVKEIKVELRRMRALEKERDQLERLLAAAEGKPKRAPK